MRFPWPAREFERTCAQCGYAWRVPREFAPRHGPLIFSLSAGVRMRGSALDPRGLRYSSQLDAEARDLEQIKEDTEAFKSCPRCRSQQFGQRAVRPKR